jgi:hypothetical protein
MMNKSLSVDDMTILHRLYFEVEEYDNPHQYTALVLAELVYVTKLDTNRWRYYLPIHVALWLARDS